MSHSGIITLLHRVQQMVDERFTETVTIEDLTIRQLQVLTAIEHEPGATQTDLVNFTGIDRSTLAEMVKRLSRRGLIERRRSKSDLRANLVRLTDAGRRHLAAGAPTLLGVEKSLLGALSSDERAQLLSILDRIVSRKIASVD